MRDGEILVPIEDTPVRGPVRLFGVGERRRHPRLPVRLPVAFAAGTAKGQGIMVSLSLSGCTVESPVVPGPDEFLSLHVSVPYYASLVSIDSAIVRWTSNGRFGVEFVTISRRAQLILRDTLRRVVR